MLRSKAVRKASSIKRWLATKEKSDTRLEKIFGIITKFIFYKIYYPVIRSFYDYKDRIQRSLAYAKFGWSNYDFDASYLYDLLAFKMQRLYDCLENGYVVQQKEDMEALKEAIQICKRLYKDDYKDKYLKIHDTKWGTPKREFTPNYDSKGQVISYSLKIYRKNTRGASEKIKKQERKELVECFKKGEADRKNDINRLAYLLKKYDHTWWD